jgi:CheY-like chemotaxis protein/anti-sigma regulatory factor (Ser/Thr protein kinase)
MTLSHELRTPMTAILGWAKMLPGISASDPMFREAVESIGAAASLQARLIDDILDVSRIVAGKMRLSPELCEISRVILNAVDAVRSTAAAKSIVLTTELEPTLGRVVVDPTRIQQVVWNLVSNAVKFTPAGGTVRVLGRRSSSQIEIEVSDTGEGIPPSFLPNVFEPFRQAESPHTRTHGGLGLGLSIVRYIVEAHGGTVSAKSEGKGKGATFTVSLPLVREKAAGQQDDSLSAGEQRHRSGRLEGLAIAVVEDDMQTRKMISAILRSSGASVHAYESSLSALEAIERQQPDVVVTDIAMPGMDGTELAAGIRERDPERRIKLIALSAFPAAPQHHDRFDVYLAKPIDPFHLVDEIIRICAVDE